MAKDIGTESPEQPLIRRGDRVIFDGDSLTSAAGKHPRDVGPYGRMLNWHETYADRVAQWLLCNRPDLKVETRNAAIGGSSSATMLSRYETAVKPHSPHMVIMTIGTNDGLMDVPVDQFADNLAQYCQALQADSGGRVVYVGGFVPCPNIHPPEARQQIESGAPYFARAEAVVEKHAGLYINVGARLLQRAEALVEIWPYHTIYSFGVHYNPVGHEIIAMTVLETLGLLSIET